MYEAITTFNTQFAYEPEIIGATDDLPRHKKYLVVGMGGSHLAAGLLKSADPSLDIFVHRNYGLPALSDDELRSRLIIASSYSGNTEEVISAYDAAREKNLDCVTMSVGGALRERAERDGIPSIILPDTGIQPRSALGFGVRALLTIVGAKKMLEETRRLEQELDPPAFEDAGHALAQRLSLRVPVVYASSANEAVAYNWKIKFNETGKVPAFYNVVPELNHNEMTGFDVTDATRALSERFSFIFLKDAVDHPQVRKRMNVMEKLFADRGLPVITLNLEGKTSFHKIFSSLILADWAAYYTAEGYGLDPEQVPIIEEFKRLIASQGSKGN